MSLTRHELLAADLVRFIPLIRDDDLNECSAFWGHLKETREVKLHRLANRLGKYFLWARKHRDEIRHYVLKTPEGDPVAIGGYSTGGVVWFLCTDLVDSHKKSFVKAIRGFRDEAWGHSLVLTNVMMWENVLHRRFLEKLGADFSLSDVSKASGKEFVRFYITNK